MGEEKAGEGHLPAGGKRKADELCLLLLEHKVYRYIIHVYMLYTNVGLRVHKLLK